MSNVFSSSLNRERGWQEAVRTARRLQSDPTMQKRRGQTVTLAFEFSDGIVKMTIPVSVILDSSQTKLAGLIYDEVVGAVGPKH